MTSSRARLLTVVSMVTAPALLGAALLIDVSSQADDNRELLQLIAEQPGAWTAGQVLFLLSALAWLPAGLVLLRLFGRSVFGRIATVAVAIGGLAMLPIDAAGLYLTELATSDVSPEQQVSLVDGVENSPILLVLEAVHVVGLMLGLLMVGVAMLRQRDLPRWTGVLVLVGFVGILTAPERLLVAVAAVLLVVGFGVAAARVDRPSEAIGGPRGREARSTAGRRAVGPTH